jgi:hypothetical protein
MRLEAAFYDPEEILDTTLRENLAELHECGGGLSRFVFDKDEEHQARVIFTTDPDACRLFDWLVKQLVDPDPEIIEAYLEELEGESE